MLGFDFSFKKFSELEDSFNLNVRENKKKLDSKLGEMNFINGPIAKELNEFRSDKNGKEFDRKKIKLNLNKFTKAYEEVQTIWKVINDNLQRINWGVQIGYAEKEINEAEQVLEDAGKYLEHDFSDYSSKDIFEKGMFKSPYAVILELNFRYRNSLLKKCNGKEEDLNDKEKLNGYEKKPAKLCGKNKERN